MEKQWNFLRKKKEIEVFEKMEKRREAENDWYLTDKESDDLKKIEKKVALRRGILYLIIYDLMLIILGNYLILIIMIIMFPFLMYLVNLCIDDGYEPSSGHDGYC